MALLSPAVSCEKTVEFGGGEQTPMLAIVSLAVPGRELGLYVSYSTFFLDNNSDDMHPGIVIADDISDFKVLVNGKDTYKYVLEDDQGNYTCPYVPKEGDVIKISASAHGFAPVTAETEVPVKAVFAARQEGFSEIDSTHDAIKLSVTISDRAGSSDFYLLRTILRTTYSFISPDTGLADSVVYESAVSYSSVSPVFRKLDINSFIGDIVGGVDDSDDESSISHLFSDAIFEGKEYTIPLTVNADHFKGPVNFNYGGGPLVDDYSVSYAVTCDLAALSDDCYYYYMSKENSSSYDYFGGMFGEPVQIYSNAEGGVGFLGAIVGNASQLEIVKK